MKEQSGRSLIEIIGVLAIGVIMIVSAYNMYKSIDRRQARLIASETLADVAKKTKILYEFSGYQDASIANLVAAEAISDSRAPIGTSWEIQSENDDSEFSISVRGLTYDECKYFVIKKTDWAYEKTTDCSKDRLNTMTFYVK